MVLRIYLVGVYYLYQAENAADVVCQANSLSISIKSRKSKIQNQQHAMNVGASYVGTHAVVVTRVPEKRKVDCGSHGRGSAT
jgi:hypothetical protein